MTIRKSKKVYLSVLKWLRFGSNRGVGRISGNNANVKEMKRGRENDECALGKDYDTERRLFGGNGYRDLSDACTVEISIDSPLGWIPSVVSAPIPHSHPLTLPFHSPATLLLLLPPITLSWFEVLSPSVHRYLSRNGFLHRCPIWRVLFSISPLSFTFTFSIFTPCFLSIFWRQFDLTRKKERKKKRVKNRSKIHVMNTK